MLPFLVAIYITIIIKFITIIIIYTAATTPATTSTSAATTILLIIIIQCNNTHYSSSIRSIQVRKHTIVHHLVFPGERPAPSRVAPLARNSRWAARVSSRRLARLSLATHHRSGGSRGLTAHLTQPQQAVGTRKLISVIVWRIGERTFEGLKRGRVGKV